MELAQEVGDQIGLALESARLLEEAQRRAARDRLLAEITARVRASMDPEAILRAAVQELGAALGADRVYAQLRHRPPTETEEEPPDEGDGRRESEGS